MILSNMCIKYNVNKFIFSSLATVYGDNDIPFIETMKLRPTSTPYGETKVMSKRILIDISKVNLKFSTTILRYFNPIGAHKSGLLGESPIGIPNNIMLYIAKVAKGEINELCIFRDDYPTVDGTCIRDYIHVMDLAEGHLAALNNITDGIHIYNLGTGKGTSVLKLVKAFEKANNVLIPYKFVDRRQGDIAECYAYVSKAKLYLGWSTKRGILEMCRDSWKFESRCKNK